MSTIPARREPSTQHSFSKEELIACGRGTLFGPGNAQLPVENMLMLDRITHISAEGGAHRKGEIIAELDRHIIGQQAAERRTLIGAAGIAAIAALSKAGPLNPPAGVTKQSILGWRGNPGRGRALGAGEIKFTGQVLPEATKVVYHIHLKRVMERKLVMGIADGELSVDGRVIYTAHDLRVGLFTTAADALV